MSEELNITTSDLVLSSIFVFQRKDGVRPKDIKKFICNKRKRNQSKVLEKATKEGISSENGKISKIRSEVGKNATENVKEFEEAEESSDSKKLGNVAKNNDYNLEPMVFLNNEVTDSPFSGNDKSQEFLRFARLEKNPESNSSKKSEGNGGKAESNDDEDDDFFDDEDDDDDPDFFEDDCRPRSQESNAYHSQSTSETLIRERIKKGEKVKKKKNVRKETKLNNSKQRKTNFKQKSSGRTRFKKMRRTDKRNEKEEAKENEVERKQNLKRNTSREQKKKQKNENLNKKTYDTSKPVKILESGQKSFEEGNKKNLENEAQTKNKVRQELKSSKNHQDIKKENEEKKEENSKQCADKKKSGTPVPPKKNFSGVSSCDSKKFKRKRSSSLFRPRKKNKS